MAELEQGHHEFIDWVVSDEAVVNTGMVHRYDEEVDDIYYWDSEEGGWIEGISPDMQYLILEMGGEVPEFKDDPEENLDKMFYEAMVGRLGELGMTFAQLGDEEPLVPELEEEAN